MKNIPMDVFFEETSELLFDLEISLLELEENIDQKEAIDRIFRSLHTIKGSGSMFGFENIANFVHDLETAFDLVRDGLQSVSKELVSLTLAAKDQIQIMLSGDQDEIDANEPQRRDILRALDRELQKSHNDKGDFSKVRVEDSNSDIFSRKKDLHRQLDNSREPKSGITYRIRFKPIAQFFQNGSNPVPLLEELASLGPCCIVAHTEAIPDLSLIDYESCYTYWDIVITTSESIEVIRDVFIFVEDRCELNITIIDEFDACDDTELDYKRLGQILVERGDLSESDLKIAVSRQKRLGELLVDMHAVSQEHINSALAEQAQVKKLRKARLDSTQNATLRVAADKLDVLVDLVGELVTIQARLSQRSLDLADRDLYEISEVIERLTAELRDNTMSIRMLPIDATFNKLKRLVRDLSQSLNKDVVMITEGGDTELDKTVIEQLTDPLIHILRNSIDHGIEPMDQREKEGKQSQGVIRLSAEHSGGNVLIRISDDGAGLDAEAIRSRAIDRGLLTTDAKPDQKELFGMIFTPGFSTAHALTNVSGRGVGMDVVKRSIENLRGHIELDSSKGAGTNITLVLPLTLAIIDGLLVKVAQENYVLPLSIIEECTELPFNDSANTCSGNILNIRGRIVPYINLREQFDIAGKEPAHQQVVIIDIEGQTIGIVVDRVVGEHQIVIKNIGRLYRNIEEISGATILADGTLALILDIPKLIQTINTNKQAA